MGAYLDSALRAEALHELTLPGECSFHLLTQPSRACIVSVGRGRSLPDTPIRTHIRQLARQAYTITPQDACLGLGVASYLFQQRCEGGEITVTGNVPDDEVLM